MFGILFSFRTPHWWLDAIDMKQDRIWFVGPAFNGPIAVTDFLNQRSFRISLRKYAFIVSDWPMELAGDVVHRAGVDESGGDSGCLLSTEQDGSSPAKK